MKQITILSGKGGTGKTTISAAFIGLAKSKGFADCDVDAPNLMLLMNDEKQQEVKDFYGLKKAIINKDLCIKCEECEKLCRFGAIHDRIVNQYECEGCGVCERFCKAIEIHGKSAITLEENISSNTYLSKSNNGIFSYAELKIGSGASGKLVTEVRKNLFNNLTDEELIIIDGSPGIGCPVIASMTGVNMILVVAEPSISGLHDLKRIIETAKKFGTKCIVCINKYDLNNELSEQIEKYCTEKEIGLVGKIPYDENVSVAINMGKTIIDFEDSIASQAIKLIWDKTYNLLIK